MRADMNVVIGELMAGCLAQIGVKLDMFVDAARKAGVPACTGLVELEGYAGANDSGARIKFILRCRDTKRG